MKGSTIRENPAWKTEHFEAVAAAVVVGGNASN
jgi:hypothetical protein